MCTWIWRRCPSSTPGPLRCWSSITTVPAHVERTVIHSALFYRGAQDYLDGALPFIEAGLAAGEPVMAAVPTANLLRLRSALGGAVEQVQTLDMTEAGRNPGRIIPAVLRDFATPTLISTSGSLGSPSGPAAPPRNIPLASNTRP